MTKYHPRTTRVLSGILLAAGLASTAFADSKLPSADKFRVLFYGQSITAQPWTSVVQKRLIEHYPDIDFEFANPAIGGFISTALVRSSEHDLYPWYPDLLIFHVYGPAKEYDDIIRRTRERTTSSIVIQSSHIDVENDNFDVIKNRDAENASREVIAAKYNCDLCDVTPRWRDYLKVNNVAPRELLSDCVHPNTQGQALMADIVFDEIKDLPVFKNLNSNYKTTIDIDSPAVTKLADGSLELRFHGNRIEVLPGTNMTSGQAFTLLLDEKPVAGLNECRQSTRPSRLGKPLTLYWMPTLKQVGFSTIPGIETWTMKILPAAEGGNPVTFTVEGSKTGPDGTGTIGQDFISNSGKVTIDANAWTLKDLPEGHTTTWETYPTFSQSTDGWKAGEYQLLAQGFSNEEHVLTIQLEAGADIDIAGFRILRPPLATAATH
jgi:hypothetical protein